MKRMDYREGSEMLRKAGFTTLEIEQLSKLRSRYSDQETQQASGTNLTKSDTWFEKMVQKIAHIWRHLADTVGVHQAHEHFLD